VLSTLLVLLFWFPLAAGPTANTMFDMEFVKWLAGFLIAGYGPLLYYMKTLLDERKNLLETQLKHSEDRSTMTETIRKVIEGEIRARFLSVIEEKDERLKEQEEELKLARARELKMLTKQIEDAHKQESALEGVSEDYSGLAQTLKPILAECVELLNYYRQRREKR